MADGDGMNAAPVLPPPAAPDVVQAPQVTPAQAAAQFPYPTTDYPTVPVPLDGGTPQPTDPAVAQHMNWLQRALSDVSDILGGDKTYTLTKAADGTMSVTQQPSTQGEKWGRIAAAALGGAAQGLAHSTGTNALPQAAAAGFQTGVQIPVTQEKNREQEAAFQNAQLMNQANRIHLTQQGYILGQQAKLNDLKLNEASMAEMNNTAEMLRNAPNAEDIGKVDPSDPNSAMNLLQKTPGAMDAFLGKGSKVIRYAMEPDHQMHAFMTDRTWEERLNDQPVDVQHVGTDAKGNPTIMHQTAEPGTVQMQKVLNNNTAAWNQYYKNLQAKSAADKSESEANATPLAKSYADAVSRAAQATDPAEKQMWNDVANRIDTQQRRLRATKAGGTGEGGGGGAGGGGAVVTPQDTENFLSTINPNDAALVRSIGELRTPPPNRFTKEGERINSLVQRAYPGYDFTNWQNYLKTKADFAPAGKDGQTMNFIGTALTHMDRMEGNIDALGNVSAGVFTRGLNAIKNYAERGSNPQLKNYMVDREAVADEVAKAYNSGAITNAEHDHFMDLINTSDSPQSMHSSLTEFRSLLAGKLGQMRDSWNDQMPRSIRQPMLDRLIARGTDYQPPAAPAAAAAAPAAAAPAAAAAPQQATNPLAGKPFDPARYASTHPGADVNDAIRRAKAAGMHVLGQ